VIAEGCKICPMKRIILKTLCWPLFIGTLIALLFKALWGKSMDWESDVLFTTLDDKSWPARTWFKGWLGSTLGYGVLLAPNASDSTRRHELVHVEQYEAAAVLGLVLGLIVWATVHSAWGIAALFACWMLTPWLSFGAALLVAWLRGEASAYRGSHLEEAAYNADR
jgi:hypothetical protein